MASQKLPFNVASFDKVTRFGYTWVDKTRLIPLLESEDSSGCRSTEEALCRQLAETFDVLPNLRLRILGSNAGCRLSSV